jgi:hypothetical protein
VAAEVAVATVGETSINKEQPKQHIFIYFGCILKTINL